MGMQIDLSSPAMRTKTIQVTFDRDRLDAKYAVVNGQFIVPLDKAIRVDYINQLRVQGHDIQILPDVRMVATPRPSKRTAALNLQERTQLAALLSGDSVDTSPLEHLLREVS